MGERRLFVCRGLVFPSTDVEGQWVSHCLDYDIVSQGNDPRHATLMMVEAVVMTLAEDMAGGFDPSDRIAPQDDWDRFYSLQKQSTKLDTEEVFKRVQERGGCAVLQFDLEMQQMDSTPRQQPRMIPQSQSTAFAQCSM